MCGIVGYVGEREARPVLLAGLQKLEYRGYDSAGVMLAEDGRLAVVKRKGRLAELTAHLDGKYAAGQCGAGHTRWATHGRPSDENAHPHLDCGGDIGVVHNGIIENYQELRRELAARGHLFRSETDTEVLPHLIEEHYEGDLLEAVRSALRHVHGSYAIVVQTAKEPGRLVVARQDSPLVIGLGEGENFVASDIPAVLPYTREVYVLEDGEIAEVTADAVNVFDAAGNRVDKNVFRVDWSAEMAEKGGYDHFMLKEIHEQPKAVRHTLAGKLVRAGEVQLAEIDLPSDYLNQINKVMVVACGTAWHAGLVGKRVIEQLAHLPVETDIASEFRYRDPMVDQQTLTIVVSQSGETADTLAALREAQRRGSRVLAITNVVGSSIAREADRVLYTQAGPEIAVASTKAYITQLVSFYVLALWMGLARERVDAERAQEIIAALERLPDQVASMLDVEGDIRLLAAKFHDREHAFYIGRGLDWAVAMEGALKLKEISYIHAEAYAAGELKHGTLALIEEGVPVVALVTQTDLADKMLSNIKEVKARGAVVIAIAPDGQDGIEEEVDYLITIPRTIDFVAPVLTVVPLQLLAYYMATARGCDVDKPRNLAKSVTVE